MPNRADFENELFTLLEAHGLDNYSDALMDTLDMFVTWGGDTRDPQSIRVGDTVRYVPDGWEPVHPESVGTVRAISHASKAAKVDFPEGTIYPRLDALALVEQKKDDQ